MLEIPQFPTNVAELSAVSGPPLLATPVSTRDIAALNRDFALFTVGAFFTHGGLDVDPVSEFLATHSDPNADVYVLEFDKPVVAGLGRDANGINWDLRLLGTPREYWPELQHKLSGVACVTRGARRFWTATTQLIVIGSRVPVSEVKPTAASWLAGVTCFGIDANDGQILFEPRGDILRVGRMPARPQTIAASRAFLADGSNAFDFFTEPIIE